MGRSVSGPKHRARVLELSVLGWTSVGIPLIVLGWFPSSYTVSAMSQERRNPMTGSADGHRNCAGIEAAKKAGPSACPLLSGQHTQK